MANLVAVLLPPLAVVVAAVLSWNEFVEPVDLVILVVTSPASPPKFAPLWQLLPTAHTP